MRLGRASAYAVLATVHIAERAADGPTPVRDIAAACHIPLFHLQKILQLMVHARILASERGPGGGFALRRAPEQITLLEIVEAIDGRIVGEITGPVNGKKLARTILQATVDNVARHARTLLSQSTVYDLMEPAPTAKLP